MARRTIKLITVLIYIPAVFFACGSQGDIFGGQENLPIAGVTPWAKIDLFANYELAQPFILLSGENEEFLEPCLLKTRGEYRLYFERATFDFSDGSHLRSSVYLATSPNGFAWEIANDNKPVLHVDQPWEGNSAGAPSVIPYKGGYRMYYSAGSGAGIGMAYSDDGINWQKEGQNPVMVSDQLWEDGRILSPSAALSDGMTRIWYAGGNAGHEYFDQGMGQAIGYAQSEDGVEFIKIDSDGNTSWSTPGKVRPIFTPLKAWEGYHPETDDPGAVGMPGVLAEQSRQRTVYRMYYTGHKIGNMFDDNASIGYAGSFDGINFERAADILNPVLTEIFALQVPGVSDLLDYDEFSASVIKESDQLYLMVYSQIDTMDWLSYGLKGIAIASCPPLN